VVLNKDGIAQPLGLTDHLDYTNELSELALQHIDLLVTNHTEDLDSAIRNISVRKPVLYDKF